MCKGAWGTGRAQENASICQSNGVRCVPNVRAGGCATSCESDLPWLQLLLTIWERQEDTGPRPPFWPTLPAEAQLLFLFSFRS